MRSRPASSWRTLGGLLRFGPTNPQIQGVAQIPIPIWIVAPKKADQIALSSCNTVLLTLKPTLHEVKRLQNVKGDKVWGYKLQEMKLALGL